MQFPVIYFTGQLRILVAFEQFDYFSMLIKSPVTRQGNVSSIKAGIPGNRKVISFSAQILTIINHEKLV
jgi:hypothetical protein